MTRCVLIVLSILCSMSTVSAQKPLVDMGKLRSLDLLFVVSQASNAITEVTTGIDGYQIDHVGIVRKENGKTTVIEAVYEGVREVSLDDFMRSAPIVLVGRSTKPFDKRQTIFNVLSLVGRPYDFVYRTGLETVYCSELVSESYVDRHGEKLYETLVTREEMLRSVDMGHYFRIAPDARGLNYDKFYVEGTVHTEGDEAYTSHNTVRLDVDGVVKKIMGTDYVREELEGRPHAVEA